MIIVLVIGGICFGLFILGWAMDNDEMKFVSKVLGGIFGSVALLFLVINPLVVRGGIREFESVRQTLVAARGNPGISPLELAAIQTEVIEANRWLVSNQYYRKNPLTNWFVPEDVMKLEPIR